MNPNLIRLLAAIGSGWLISTLGGLALVPDSAYVPIVVGVIAADGGGSVPVPPG